MFHELQRILSAAYIYKKYFTRSRSAKNICKRLFPTSDTNDESDACRHFVWAGLLRSDLGALTANAILDAHEEEPDQPLREKTMDLANNKSGILNAEKLIQEKRFSEDQTLKDFVNELKAGHLNVIDKRLKTLEDLKP